MSDVQVKFTGDASGASEASHEAAHGIEEIAASIGKATALAHLMEVGFEKLKETIVDSLKESIDLFAKEEVAIKQLEAAAHENADAFREQAEAMKEHLGVSAEMVMHLQTLASRFDVMPTQIEPATKAVLDWAAITGGDATGGMQALIRAVEFGTGHVKSLGIEFAVTGDKTKDMESAIAALSNRFGGGAETMADTLTGRMNKAKEASDDLKKSFGSFFDEVATKTHAVELYTLALKGWALQVQSITHPFGGGNEGGTDKEVNDVTHQAGAGAAAFNIPKIDKAPKDVKGATASDRDDRRTFTEEQDDLDLKLELRNAEEKLKTETEYQNKLLKEMQDGQKATMAEQDKEQAESAKEYEKQWQAIQKQHQQEAEEALRAQKKLADEMNRQAKELEKDMTKAGAAIGESLVHAISDSLVQALQGQEVDVLGVVSDTAFSVAAIIANVVGDYYGGPAAGQLAGTAVAGLGAVAHQARANAWQDEQNRRKHHDGGWVEPPRYHLGTDEVPAILQSGEAVLSRNDVARAGGRKGVEAMRRGGGGDTYISAFDARSMVEMFEDRGGRAIYVAAQTGRGDIAGLLGNR